MRLGAIVQQLLAQVHHLAVDEAGRIRLAEIHRRSTSELKDGLIPELTDGLTPELMEELERITLPFNVNAPSEDELRLAPAQLMGWLEGVSRGIQTALFAEQMSAQQQLQSVVDVGAAADRLRASPPVRRGLIP